MKLIRPVSGEFPVSAEYGRWGVHWNRHICKDGTWVRGQVDGRGQHKGIDFAVPEDTIVLAMADGYIERSGWENGRDPKQGFGQRVRQQVTLEKGRRLTLVYAHLSYIYAREGHQVAQGDRIGLSGNTGRSTGPHLHIELVDARGQYHPINFDEIPIKTA